MALFGGKRDIGLFRSINKELIENIIESTVDIYTISVDNTISNVYGESTNKKWNIPIRLQCMIRRSEQTSDYSVAGYNVKQTITYHFITDHLKDRNLYISIGDIIHWDNKYWEIDHIIRNKYFLDKNPDTNKDLGDNYGWDIALSCVTHLTQRTITSIEDTYTGINNNINNNNEEEYL